MVTVHREGRTSQAPIGGSRKELDRRDVRRVCEELGLDWSEAAWTAKPGVRRTAGFGCRSAATSKDLSDF